MSAKSQIWIAIEKLEAQAHALETEAAGLRRVVQTLKQQTLPKAAAAVRKPRKVAAQATEPAGSGVTQDGSMPERMR